MKPKITTIGHFEKDKDGSIIISSWCVGGWNMNGKSFNIEEKFVFWGYTEDELKEIRDKSRHKH